RAAPRIWPLTRTFILSDRLYRFRDLPFSETLALARSTWVVEPSPVPPVDNVNHVPIGGPLTRPTSVFCAPAAGVIAAGRRPIRASASGSHHRRMNERCIGTLLEIVT